MEKSIGGKSPGDAGETIVATPGDAKEPPTTATRSNMNGSSLGHSSSAKNICMERRSDVLAKKDYLLPQKRTISWAKLAQREIKQ